MAVVKYVQGPRALSGPGAVERIGAEATALAGKGAPLLLIADPGVPLLAARLRALLEAAGHPVETFDGISSDPKATQVDAAAEAARRCRARAVVGLGGGSGLDVAKLAAAVAPGEASVSAYGLCASPFPSGTLPVLAVPTTSGTGSEATRTAIFSRGDGAKLWAWGPELLPRVAILDPEMTVGLPPALTAATGIDALVHAVEAATNRNASSFSRAPALEAVRLVAASLRQAVVQGDDLVARGQVQIAAFLAGQAIDAAGTGVAHALGHALGALGHVHHGRAVGLALGAALRQNAEAAPAAHAAVARALGLEGADAAVLNGLEAAYLRLCGEVGLERGLSALGLDPAILAAEAQKPENAPMLASNCRAYSGAELTLICRRLLD